MQELSEKGVTLIDASELHAYLFLPEGILPMQTFDDYRARPPKGWPESLSAVWGKALEHCRSLVAGQSVKESLANRMACSQRISTFLWQAYVTELKAARVFEVNALVDEEKDEVTVSGATWAPAEATVLSARQVSSVASASDTVSKVVKALVAKSGAAKPREVVKLETSGAVDVWAGQAEVTTPVELKKSCPTLPAKLTFATPSVLGRSLAAGWAPSGATGAPLACELAYSQHDEELMGQFVTITTSRLTCGSTVVAADAAVMPGVKPVPIAAGKLLQSLAVQLCK